MSESPVQAIPSLVDWLRNARTATIFSGAGMSTLSGALSVETGGCPLSPVWALGARYNGSSEEITVKASEEDLIKRITIDPGICHGKPCIRGLRYPVETVLQWLSAGMSNEDILADYPDLERDDILAALLYAARLSQVKHITRTA